MNKPVKKYFLGGCSISIWMNEFNGKQTTSFSLEKSYKDKSGEWKNTSYFYFDDLMKLKSIIDTVIANKVNSDASKREQNPKIENSTDMEDSGIPF